VIEPYRVSTEAIRVSVASLPDAGRRDLAIALQALSQVVAVQDALGEQFDERTVEVFGKGRCCSPTASRSSSGSFRWSSCSGLGDSKRARCERLVGSRTARVDWLGVAQVAAQARASARGSTSALLGPTQPRVVPLPRNGIVALARPQDDARVVVTFQARVGLDPQ
jgi:hypothetical protein